MHQRYFCMKKLLPVILLSIFFGHSAYAQYYSNANKTIPGNWGDEVYDTININNLSPAILNGTFGLDSVTLNITDDWTPNLIISLISPDGTVLQISDWEGWGADFTGACFSMDVSNMIQFSGNPFTGNQRPEDWLGRINNGQNGNGNWVLHIVNQPGGYDPGTLINWGVHFSNTPAPPDFFYISSLPIIEINTNDVPVLWNDVAGHMGIIDNGAQPNHTNDPFNNYSGNISMHVRGSSSSGFPQKSYAVSTQDINGNDSDASLLTMPADHSWVLYAPWDDKTFLRNVLTYRISNEMGDYAVRTHMCQLVLNGDYKGVYVLMEKISRGSNRVAVHKMNSGDTAGNALTGGYIFECDRGWPGYDSWQSNFPYCQDSINYAIYAYVYPKFTDIVQQQKDYIYHYVDSFEYQANNGDLYDSTNGFLKYIDVQSFIDQELLQELGHNVDGYRLSTYYHKDRGGKLFGGPIWDFNEGYGNSDYDDGWRYDTYQYQQTCPYPGYIPTFWPRINTDTSYHKELACRYSNLRLSVLDTIHLQGMIDSYANALAIPASLHYERWPVMGVYLWPNYYVGNSYQDEITYLKTWLRNRINFFDTTIFITSCIDTTHDTVITPNVIHNIQQQSISIYPNPTTNNLSISSSAMLNGFNIVNMFGQQIYETRAVAKSYTVSMHSLGLTPGVYTITVFKANGYHRQKAVLSD